MHSHLNIVAVDTTSRSRVPPLCKDTLKAKKAFEYAADIWAAHIESPVPIKIEVGFTGNSALLGEAWSKWASMEIAQRYSRLRNGETAQASTT